MSRYKQRLGELFLYILVWFIVRKLYQYEYSISIRDVWLAVVMGTFCFLMNMLCRKKVIRYIMHLYRKVKNKCW